MASNLWLSFAFLTASIYATLSLLDKVVTDKQPLGPTLSVTIKSVPMFLLFGAVGIMADAVELDITSLSIEMIAFLPVALAIGVAYVLYLYMYYRGMEETEVSILVPLINTDILFVLAFGAIMLGETFSLPVYGGIFLIFTGLILLSLENISSDVEFTSRGAFLFGFGTAIGIASVQLLMKLLTAQLGRYELLFWFGACGLVAAGGLIGIQRFRRSLRTTDTSLRSAATVFLLLNSVLTSVAYFTFIWAIELGPVSIVVAITNLEVMLVFFGVLVLSMYTPEVLREEMGVRTLLQKFVASSLMLFGVVLIQLFQ